MSIRTVLCAAAMLGGLTVCTAAATASPPLTLTVLSSPRPDLVSGGDALVEIRGSPGPVSLTVNGTAAPPPHFDASRNSLVGLVGGLKLGRNRLVARSGHATTRLTIVNHSKNGPILSGPQIWPYECRTVQAGLGPALDRYCNAPTKIERYYRSTDGTFKRFSEGSRPADVATTVTLDGRTVPYVVRVESGTLDRTIYRIAILDDPSAPQGAGWRPGPGWNRRLTVMFEGGLAGRYEQGFTAPTSVLNDLYLSRGFAVMNASGLVNGLVSNAVLQGETLMMLKEHFIKAYGVPKWTVGTGGSGGAIQQINITELYPGLLDGIQAQSSFADSQVATVVLDCDLMENYWKKTGEKGWTEEQKAAVSGYASPLTCDLWYRFIAPNLKVDNKAACGLHDLSLVYDPKTNPKGARCGMYPWLVNELGRDPKTGFPYSAYDNVGVQYGLAALNEGKISVDQFLNLNQDIGGYTADSDYSPQRTSADPKAMRRLYSSGLVNSGGGGLATTPLITYRSYGDPQGDFHDRERDLSIRLRMIRANGDAANQVIWVGPRTPDSPPGKPKPLEVQVLDAMTPWLDAIASDPAPLSHAKIVRLKPPAAVDAYFDSAGTKHPAEATMDPSSAFNIAYPIHGNPRIAAGAPPTNDVLKCRLKPIDFAEYKPAFSAEQARRLREIFSSGVCDFHNRGVGQVAQAGTFVRY